MPKRMWLIVAGGIAAIAIAWFAMRAALAPTPGITLENSVRLYCGMPSEEVDGLLGDATDKFEPIWECEGVQIQLRFVRNILMGGKCVNGDAIYYLRLNPSIFQRLKNILGI